MINTATVAHLHVRYGKGRNAAVPWWFQAPAHHSVAVHQRLQQLFPNWMDSIGHNVEWPPMSPHLTPLDSYPMAMLTILG